MKWVASIAAFLALGTLVYFGPNLREYWGKRYADADRAVFEESTPYIRGSIQYISGLRDQYQLSTDPAHKQILRGIIVKEADKLGHDKLPTGLRDFVNKLENTNAS